MKPPMAKLISPREFLGFLVKPRYVTLYVYQQHQKQLFWATESTYSPHDKERSEAAPAKKQSEYFLHQLIHPRPLFTCLSVACARSVCQPMRWIGIYFMLIDLKSWWHLLPDSYITKEVLSLASWGFSELSFSERAKICLRNPHFRKSWWFRIQYI